MRVFSMLAILLAACAAEPRRDFPRELLASGKTVAELAGDAPAVVLALSPEDAFVCANHVDMWVQWARRTGGPLHVVFSRPPTEVERRQLALMRITRYETLRDGSGGTRNLQSREYLVESGRITYSADVRAGQLGSPLLSHAQRGTLADLARE